MTPEYGHLEFRTVEWINSEKVTASVTLNTCTESQIRKALEGAQAFEKLDT
jgi:hypothetical protein